MSKNSLMGQNNLRFLYYRYKDSPYYSFGVAVIILSVSLILFFQIIIPQIENWFSIRNEVIATRARIDTINNNINFMKNIDKAVLNKQVSVMSDALPTEKDFGPIINALSESAVQSGVALDDFQFQVGDTSSSSGKLNNTAQKDLSAIKLTFVLTGDASGIGLFLKEIEEKLPLSEVESVEGDSLSTTVKIQFYQKEFPKIIFKDDQPLPQLSKKQLELINKLSGWQIVQSQESQETSSESGIPLF